MSKNKLFFYLMVAIISLSYFQITFAEIDCPGENDPCLDTEWEDGTYSDHVGTTGANFKVSGTYKWRCEAPWNKNGNKVVDKWHWEPCGDVCCEKTYEICKEYSAAYGGTILKINNVNRHKLAGSECSKEGQFFKWDTMTPIPCKDGCQGDGN